MDCRGFESGEAMNEHMIRQWNSRVREGDEVVILGDFCLSRDTREVTDLMDQLHGKKYLVEGNHDKFLENRLFDRSRFGWIEKYKELNDNKRKVILSHYPVMCYNGQYRLNKEGEPPVYMLYGHVHNSFDEYLVNEYIEQTKRYRRSVRGSSDMVEIPCQMINCFCMFSDYIPLTLDEWIELDRKRREKIAITDYDVTKTDASRKSLKTDFGVLMGESKCSS
jgi:calcineurin-like phosphoesterase family protein